MQINGKIEDNDFIDYLEAKIKLQTIREFLEELEEGSEEEAVKLIRAIVKDK